MKFFSSARRSAIVILPPATVESSQGSFAPSEFLSAISHELKTPISAIIGMSEIIKEEKNCPPQVAEFAIEINNTANDLYELVRDLLDVTKGSYGNFSVDLKNEVDVKDVIRRAVRLNHDYALKRHIEIKTEISDNIFGAKLDAQRMKQVMTNLISNAIKYSPEGTQVKITAQNINKNNEPMLEICVIDEGFGMSKEQVEIAFEKYKTITNPNSGQVDSFGMGLAIVHHLVELQNGIIEIDSELKIGTRMRMIFPVVH